MKPMELNLPSDMMACVESFMTFYNASAKQRKLLWIYGQGQCQVKATFGGKAYDLMMSPVQAVVLSLFNEEERLTAAQVHDKVGKDVPVETLNRVLFSFISKYKILTKEPVSKKVEPTDSFSVNQVRGARDLKEISADFFFARPIDRSLFPFLSASSFRLPLCLYFCVPPRLRT